MDQSTTTTTSEPLPHVLSDLPTDYPDLPNQQPPNRLDPSKPVPKREVLQCDAIEYLKGINQFPDGSSVVTSLPDVCEVNMNFETWKAWFIDAAVLILEKTPPDQVAIFYQTDIKVKGVWIDKGFFVQLAAEKVGCNLLWHRIVLITQPNQVKFKRPCYSHLMCFSKKRKENINDSTADVIDRGRMTWPKAMGLNACVAAVRYIKNVVKSNLIIDPFCGKGSILAVANEFGIDSFGVELSTSRAKYARRLETNALEKETKIRSKRGEQKQKQQQQHDNSDSDSDEQEQQQVEQDSKKVEGTKDEEENKKEKEKTQEE